MSTRARAKWLEPDRGPLRVAAPVEYRAPAAILLDLDDTILDDNSAVETCWRQACAFYCSELGAVDPDLLYAAVRERGEWFWSDAERHRVGRLDLDAARAEVVRLGLAQLGMARHDVAASIAGAYARARDAALQPLPEAIPTVRWLRDQGSKLALITNGAGSAQRRKIVQFGLAPLFDCILIEGEVGFGKPDRRIYLRALRELGVEAADAWMVGDHLDFDVAAPKDLGLFAIWIDKAGRGVPPGRTIRPDRIISALPDLRSAAIQGDDTPTHSF
jgi:putative hydrolase of the HAD superfamily